MLKNNTIAIFILFFCCALGRSQSFYSKNIDGRVESNSREVEGIHVQNISNKKSTITNAMGDFTIPVRVSDTLTFSGVKYYKKTLVITDALFAQKTIYITLEEFVNELEEVVIRPYNLSGNLASDVLNAKTDNIITASTLGLPGADVIPLPQNERRYIDASRGTYFTLTSINVYKILNKLSGRTDMLKKRALLEREDKKLATTWSYFTDDFYIHKLKIPKDKLDEFMFFCGANENFVTISATSDKLKIQQELEKLAVEYLKLNE